MKAKFAFFEAVVLPNF